jgi:hypothetical protein
MGSFDVQVDRMVARLRGVAPDDSTIAAALTRIGSILTARAMGNVRNNNHNSRRFPFGQDKNNLIKNGHLLNSFRTDIRKSGKGGVLTFGTAGVKYARAHEFGQRIKAKKPFGLAVPYNDWVKGRSLRQVGKTIILRKKNPTGKFLGYAVSKQRLARSRKSGPTNTRSPMFRNAISHLLLRYVDIPARPYFFPAINASIPDMVRIIREVQSGK